MTWFRCGGSGIPAALKNRMNAVFNKKFGTAVDYPPEGWPDDVNLMGPLPEGTASGNPAIITDGADRVPTKNVVVNLPASLDGYSSVNVENDGKNSLSSAEADTKTHNSVSITCDGNGKYTASGTATGGSANITFVLDTPCEIKSGMYLHLMNVSANASASITFQKQDNTTIYAPTLSPTNRIADLSSYVGQTIYSIRFYVANGASFEMTLTPMVCYGSTANAYAPYIAPTSYSANLGRTIHGGTADVVNGEGQELVKKITVSSFSGTWGAVTNGYAYYISDADTTHSTSVVNPIMMQANQLFTYGSVGRNSAPTWQYGGNDGGTTVNTFILPSEYDTLTKANNFLASLQTPLEVTLTLAAPIDFTFDGQEVDTRLGYNAFMSDQGDSEITYRRDISLALQAVSNNRGLMMASRPAIEPANGDQGSEESTENNIETEGEEDAR